MRRVRERLRRRRAAAKVKPAAAEVPSKKRGVVGRLVDDGCGDEFNPDQPPRWHTHDWVRSPSGGGRWVRKGKRIRVASVRSRIADLADGGEGRTRDLYRPAGPSQKGFAGAAARIRDLFR